MAFYIYKYVEDENIVYIGKTKYLAQRIKEHSKEDKFRNKDFSIYYFLCKNETEMNAYEYFLINKYLPALNVSCKNYNSIEITEPGWTLWINTAEEDREVEKPLNEYNQNDLITISEYARIRGVTTSAVYKRLKTTLNKYLVEIGNRKFLLKEVLNEERASMYRQSAPCELFSICNCKTATCRAIPPDESCYYYRYFKKIIEEENLKK